MESQTGAMDAQTGVTEAHPGAGRLTNPISLLLQGNMCVWSVAAGPHFLPEILLPAGDQEARLVDTRDTQFIVDMKEVVRYSSLYNATQDLELIKRL